MKKTLVVILIGFLGLVGYLAYQNSYHLSGTDKITLSFPPSLEVRLSKEQVEEVIPEGVEKEEFNKAYDGKLTLRALSCSHDEVSRFDSLIKVRSIKIDKECLAVQDDQLKDFIGSKLISYQLSQEPLRPIAKLGFPSQFIEKEYGNITSAKFASKAGVALIRNNNGDYLAVAIPSNELIKKLSIIFEANFSRISMAPNGRIVGIPSQNKGMQFYDVESGQEIWYSNKIKSVLNWMPEVSGALVYAEISKNIYGAAIVDFEQGSIKPFYNDNQSKGYEWALRLKDRPLQLIIGQHTSFSSFSFTRGDSGIKAEIIQNYKITNVPISTTPTLMLDGTAIVFLTGNILTRFDLETSEQKKWATVDLLTYSFAKMSEQSILVDSVSVLGSKSYIFDILDSTMAPVEDLPAGVSSTIVSLDERIGFIRKSNNETWIGDQVKTGQTEHIDNLIAKSQMEKQLKALEQAEQMQKAMESRDRAFREEQLALRSMSQSGRGLPSQAFRSPLNGQSRKNPGLYYGSASASSQPNVTYIYPDQVDGARFGTCTTYFSNLITKPVVTIKSAAYKRDSFLYLQEVSPGGDPLKVYVNGTAYGTGRPILLKSKSNKIDFVVNNEGEVHYWHATLSVNGEKIFEHKQPELPRKTCVGEMYRQSIVVNVE